MKERRGKNKFCLSSEEEMVVEDFVESCCKNSEREIGSNPWVAPLPDQQTNGCLHYDQPSIQHEGTLGHQLAVTKLHYGGQGRINLRKKREHRAGYEGALIIRHLGDLSKEVELREYSRKHRNQNQLKSSPKTGRFFRGKKRNRDGLDDSQQLVKTHKKLRSEVPEWSLDEESGVKFGSEMFENAVDFGGEYYSRGVCVADTRRTSPHATLTPPFQRIRWQPQMTSAGPSHNERSASINGLWSAMLEEESEGEVELKILTAQRQRRALEIEDAKDKEKEFKLRKLKLQKANQKKRLRDEGDADEEDEDRTDSRGKRQRV